MEENNIYSIVDLDGYANSLRDGVAKSFVDNYTENLDDYITLEQVKTIIIGYSLGQDDNGDYLINSEVFNDTFDDVREWFYEAGLSKLAAKGVIECAWDNETNQMIFWSNNDTKTTDTIETGDR
jgi:hypothetical protein